MFCVVISASVALAGCANGKAPDAHATWTLLVRHHTRGTLRAPAALDMRASSPSSLRRAATQRGRGTPRIRQRARRRSLVPVGNSRSSRRHALSSLARGVRGSVRATQRSSGMNPIYILASLRHVLHFNCARPQSAQRGGVSMPLVQRAQPRPLASVACGRSTAAAPTAKAIDAFSEVDGRELPRARRGNAWERSRRSGAHPNAVNTAPAPALATRRNSIALPHSPLSRVRSGAARARRDSVTRFFRGREKGAAHFGVASPARRGDPRNSAI